MRKCEFTVLGTWNYSMCGRHVIWATGAREGSCSFLFLFFFLFFFEDWTADGGNAPEAERRRRSSCEHCGSSVSFIIHVLPIVYGPDVFCFYCDTRCSEAMETFCRSLFTLAAPLFLLLLLLDLSAPAFSLSGQTIPALLGDNVNLTCPAPTGASFDALEVIKRGLGDRYVSFLRAGRLEVENQHSSYVDRVELVMKSNNSVTLILKNVTLNDSGVYECHFITSGRKTVSDGNGSFGTKSSYNITVNVQDHTDGGEEERGDLNNNGGGNTTGRDVTGTDQELNQRLLKAVLFIGGSVVAVSIIIKIW